jgi:hypothetical protein
MKKLQNNFTRASTLQVALCVALLSISTVLLTSSALEVGTYRVDIKINNKVVGSAFFQLK